MRKARTQKEIYEMQDLLYLGAHVPACILGFFVGHYLFDKPIFRRGLLTFCP